MRKLTWPSLILTGAMFAGCTSTAATPLTVAADGSVPATGITTPTGRYSITWGDGKRSSSFYGNVPFTYAPPLPPNPPDEQIKELDLSHKGEVTILKVGKLTQPIVSTLTRDEATTWGTLVANVSYEWGLCPREPGAPQPRYTWIQLGTVYEGRPTCPPDPPGLTMILAPETLTPLNAFLDQVFVRLTGQPRP